MNQLTVFDIICCKCGLSQSPNQFRWGHKACRSCEAKNTSAYVKKNPEKAYKATRRWFKETENGRARQIKSQAIQKERYPEKFKARYILNNAIRDGKLERGLCKICGVPNAHAHHKDYSKPLEVEWYCQLHHNELHLTPT